MLRDLSRKLALKINPPWIASAKNNPAPVVAAGGLGGWSDMRVTFASSLNNDAFLSVQG
jgi:hypothetical protein